MTKTESDITLPYANETDEQDNTRRSRFLTVLGIFHCACFATLVVLPGCLLVSYRATWVLLSNAYVAVALTAPISSRRAKPDSRLLYAFWLFIGYVLFLSIFISPGLMKSLADGFFFPSYDVPFMPYDHLKILFSNRDFGIAILSVIALALVGLLFDRSWLKTKALGWRPWALLALLTLLMAWRQYAVLIPPFLLLCYGCYVAFSALGSKWLWRAVLLSTFAMAWPCGYMVLQYIHTLPTGIHSFGDLFFYLRSVSGINLGGVVAGVYVTWLLIFPPMAAASIAILWHSSRRWTKLLAIPIAAVLVLELVAIAYCGRRTSYPTLLVMLLAGLVVSRRVKLTYMLIFVLVCLVALGIAPKLGIIDDNLLEYAVFDYSHYCMAQVGIDQFCQSPIYGIGPGRYNSRLPFYPQFADVINPASTCPHNDYVWLLCETGLIGFVLCLALSIRLLAALGSSLRSGTTPVIRGLAAGLIVQAVSLAMTTSFMMGVFGRPQWAWSNGAMFAALLGAAWSARKSQTEVPEPKRSVGRMAKVREMPESPQA